jgi:hypothetical protein
MHRCRATSDVEVNYGLLRLLTGSNAYCKTPRGPARQKSAKAYELLAKNTVGEPAFATPALAGNLLIVRGARHLYAITE